MVVVAGSFLHLSRCGLERARNSKWIGLVDLGWLWTVGDDLNGARRVTVAGGARWSE